MSDYRRQVYDLYVSAHLRDDADYSPTGYERASTFLHQRFRRWLPPDKGAAVLDLGCGHGKALFWLQRQGYTDLSGIDYSPEQVERARRIVPAVEKGDFFALLEGCQERYDFILALDVIEHFNPEEALRLGKTVHQALRPGGRFLVQTLNADSPFEGHLHYGDLTHQSTYNARSLETLMRLAGFSRVEFAALGPVAHGPLSAVRWLLWKFIALGLVGYHLVEGGNTGGGIFTQCFAACAHK